MQRTEEKLLLIVARRDIDDAELRSLLLQELDWDYLIAIAHFHRLLPLLHKHLAATASDLVPGNILSLLKRESVANSQSVFYLISKQLRLYKLFHENSIPVALFKGPLLAQLAYGEISLRRAGDIDVLINRDDFDRARKVLESLGYEMTPRLTPTQLSSHLKNHCEIQFMSDEWFTVVDLHWDLAPRSFVFNLKAADVMSRLQTVSLAGTQVTTFDDEDFVLYQAMHGAKHLWRRLEWISSFAEALRALKSIDWTVLLDRAATAHATRMLALSLRLVKQLSDVPIPAHVLTAIDPESAMQNLATQIRAQLFVSLSIADSTESNLYNLRVMDRKRDALISALRAIFVPTFPDWQALALPPSLHSLYYAYRPLRLSKIYGTTLWRKLRRTTAGERNA